MLEFVLALIAQKTPDPPLLRVGETTDSEITDADPVVRSSSLDKSYADSPVVGKTFRIETGKAGEYAIELRSYVQTPLDLVEKKERSTSDASSLLAVGGVDYRKRAELEEQASAKEPLVASAAVSDELRGKLSPFWSRLPQTDNEAQTVHDLFEDAFGEEKAVLLSGEGPLDERVDAALLRKPVAQEARARRGAAQRAACPAGRESRERARRVAIDLGGVRALGRVAVVVPSTSGMRGRFWATSPDDPDLGGSLPRLDIGVIWLERNAADRGEYPLH